MKKGIHKLGTKIATSILLGLSYLLTPSIANPQDNYLSMSWKTVLEENIKDYGIYVGQGTADLGNGFESNPNYQGSLQQDPILDRHKYSGVIKPAPFEILSYGVTARNTDNLESTVTSLIIMGQVNINDFLKTNDDLCFKYYPENNLEAGTLPLEFRLYFAECESCKCEEVEDRSIGDSDNIFDNFNFIGKLIFSQDYLEYCMDVSNITNTGIFYMTVIYEIDNKTVESLPSGGQINQCTEATGIDRDQLYQLMIRFYKCCYGLP